MPSASSEGRQLGPSASQVGAQLYRICRVAAEDRVSRMRIWPLPPQAQPVGQLRHAASTHQSPFYRLSTRLSQTAHCVVREPEYVSRHARLLDSYGRPLDEEALRQVRAVGATA